MRVNFHRKSLILTLQGICGEIFTADPLFALPR
jgi:hypothetical protein